MKHSIYLFLLVLLLISSCAKEQITPPQFNLAPVNVSRDRFIYNDQETSGKLAEQQFQPPNLIVSVAPDFSGIDNLPLKPVIAELLIDEKGKVEKILIIDSSNKKLDDIIMKSLFQWYFEPAYQKETQEAVKCWKSFPIYFKL